MSSPKVPKPPPAPPPPPSVDQAAQQTDQQDQLRRRRGAGATLFAGAGQGPLAPRTSAGGALLGN